MNAIPLSYEYLPFSVEDFQRQQSNILFSDWVTIWIKEPTRVYIIIERLVRNGLNVVINWL